MKAVITSVIILLALLSACGGREQPGGDNTASDSSISFSADQIEMAEIDTGRMEQRVLSEEVTCTGTIQIPPEGRITVHFPYACYIASVNVSTGQFVKKGELLAMVEHPELISLQQSYLEKKSQFSFYREEFKRQGELAVEQAASMKKMQQAESDYASREIELHSLEARLRITGIDPESLTAASITASVPLFSPASGFISRNNANRGKSFNPEEAIFELLDKSRLDLQLGIFEKDLYKVHKGQDVTFIAVHQPGTMYHARITATGQEVEEPGRTVQVLARVLDADPALVQGMYIRASVAVDPLTVYAVPVPALVRGEEGYFIFRVQEGRFYKTAVRVGIEKEGYAQVIDPPASLRQGTIVTHGAYYIAAEEESGD
ncbi:MAG: efflux RND transporter periplasmic adaptor subunit [Bacteroidales bacterium]